MNLSTVLGEYGFGADGVTWTSHISVRQKRLLALAMSWPAVMEIHKQFAASNSDAAVVGWLCASKAAFQHLEQFAEGTINQDELREIHGMCMADYYQSRSRRGERSTKDCLDDAAFRHSLRVAYRVSTEPGSENTIIRELVSGYTGIFTAESRIWQENCIRDVLEGNRLQVIPIHHYAACNKCRWKRPSKKNRCSHSLFFVSDLIKRLTDDAYGSRNDDGVLDTTLLSVLADAIEDANFPQDNHPALKHLRSAGPHVRGCWALDWVRGYEL